MFLKNVFCLVIGVIIGVRLTDFWNYFKVPNTYGRENYASLAFANNIIRMSTEPHSYRDEVTQQMQKTEQETTDTSRINVTKVAQARTLNFSLADFLFNETRVLCWIMTTPENHLKRAIHVKYTWGSRCNKLIFMSTESDSFLETVKLPVREGRPYLWKKTRAAFRYIYDYHFNDAEWFLKADDDTYVIMENLRLFLYQYSPEAPVYFGCKFHPYVKQGYMSGGAGYVLSKEALRRFAEVAYANDTICPNNKLSEDKQMGICLQNIGVAAGDSRDEEGFERFIPLAPQHLIPIDASKWLGRYLFYRGNKSCCSRHAISFHYIRPKEFYTLEYSIYRLRPFGVLENTRNILPPKANMTELMQIWRTDFSNNRVTQR